MTSPPAQTPGAGHVPVSSAAGFAGSLPLGSPLKTSTTLNASSFDSVATYTSPLVSGFAELSTATPVTASGDALVKAPFFVEAPVQTLVRVPAEPNAATTFRSVLPVSCAPSTYTCSVAPA